ncbi:TRAF3-interacting protein 1-like isoform X2 [Syngnathus scovelli]|uniref:TRAF3-interacting protein 1-like isoform X2 n=1 Tax=Syngnathus scovelli TaxID=161590 RepID=UPI0021109A5F|nr:TRAF3-interacting protein 1-like isoform X2 [Syngnathus scovelli]
MATTNSQIIKKTQSTLGKVIKKPALTEKLLSKPPFRYLHDIFSEIIRTTGFMKGLYKDNELKSECFKDKEMKMAFLQKAIDVVVLVTGEPLAVRPAHIVAGHEPEKTNEFLQTIAKCCLNKMSSKEAVRRVLAGERLDVRTKESALKSQDKDVAEGRQEKKTTTEQSESRVEEEPEPHGEPERQRRDGEREHRNAKEHRRREQELAKDAEQEDKSRHKDNAQSNEKDKGQGNKTKEKEKVKSAESERHKAASRTESPTRTSSAKGQKRKNKFGDESDGEGGGVSKEAPIQCKDAEHGPSPPNNESGDVAGSSLSPGVASSNSRATPRPSSARPAPPRVKTQESFVEGLPPERLSSAKSSVIREGKKLSDDEDEEDEQFLVAEAAPESVDALEKDCAQDLSSEAKHGGLVKKILETKKDYEPSASCNKSKEKLMSEEARRKEEDLVTREVERLRASIQSVCQSALPLGKIMDYVQEDIDAMQAELQSWRKENKEHAQALLQENKVTEQAVEPLKAELGELDQQMKDYQDKICAVRSNILTNEENIQKKLVAIISSRS